VYDIATIRYGGPIDVIVPVVAGLVFLIAAVLEVKAGAEGQRQRYDPRYPDYRGFHLAWWRPRRLWPKRFDGAVAVANGVGCILMAAMFFAIAISVILD
jgi:hypothetical protein